MNPDWIAPSILAADFARLGEESLAVIRSGADLIHFDVMDNHYVPNLTIGPAVCDSLRRFLDREGVDADIDAHLMIDPVDALIPRFADAGAQIISFHPETSVDVTGSLNAIRDAGCKAGLVFNPDVPIDNLENWLPQLDIVLLMSVFPGFGGQSFIEDTLKKIASTRDLIEASPYNPRLEVDGGLTVANIGHVAAAGADTFVAGSTIFGSDDYAETIAAMRREISTARAG